MRLDFHAADAIGSEPRDLVAQVLQVQATRQGAEWRRLQACPRRPGRTAPASAADTSGCIAQHALTCSCSVRRRCNHSLSSSVLRVSCTCTQQLLASAMARVLAVQQHAAAQHSVLVSPCAAVSTHLHAQQRVCIPRVADGLVARCAAGQLDKGARVQLAAAGRLQHLAHTLGATSEAASARQGWFVLEDWAAASASMPGRWLARLRLLQGEPQQLAALVGCAFFWIDAQCGQQLQHVVVA